MQGVARLGRNMILPVLLGTHAACRRLTTLQLSLFRSKFYNQDTYTKIKIESSPKVGNRFSAWARLRFLRGARCLSYTGFSTKHVFFFFSCFMRNPSRNFSQVLFSAVAHCCTCVSRFIYPCHYTCEPSRPNILPRSPSPASSVPAPPKKKILRHK